MLFRSNAHLKIIMQGPFTLNIGKTRKNFHNFVTKSPPFFFVSAHNHMSDRIVQRRPCAAL